MQDGRKRHYHATGAVGFLRRSRDVCSGERLTERVAVLHELLGRVGVEFDAVRVRVPRVILRLPVSRGNRGGLGRPGHQRAVERMLVLEKRAEAPVERGHVKCPRAVRLANILVCLELGSDLVVLHGQIPRHVEESLDEAVGYAALGVVGDLKAVPLILSLEVSPDEASVHALDEIVTAGVAVAGEVSTREPGRVRRDVDRHDVSGLRVDVVEVALCLITVVVAAEDLQGLRVRHHHRVAAARECSVTVVDLGRRERGTDGLEPHRPVVGRGTGETERRTLQVHELLLAVLSELAASVVGHVEADSTAVELSTAGLDATVVRSARDEEVGETNRVHVVVPLLRPPCLHVGDIGAVVVTEAGKEFLAECTGAGLPFSLDVVRHVPVDRLVIGAVHVVHLGEQLLECKRNSVL